MAASEWEKDQDEDKPGDSKGRGSLPEPQKSLLIVILGQAQS